MTASSSVDTDIVIVGGGLSGTVAATVLARAGHRVTLIDRNEVPPPEFRVEKIGGDQIEKFGRVGLLPALVANSAYFDDIVNLRRGRVVDRTRTPHYGVLYQDLVAAMRRELPATIRFVVGRVTDLATSDDVQTVTLADQPAITARLVVLASGMSDILRSRLGIERDVLREKQSLTFGFDLEPLEQSRLRFSSVTYYGEKPSDGIDYMTIFPTAHGLRANLFSFLDHRDPWVKALRASPTETLAATLPGFTRAIGPLKVAGKVQNWIMDIGVARNVIQPGIVLIGDAFQTSCPAAGTGVSRLLTDLDRLDVHVADWFKTPGMGPGKIAAFYNDPLKQAMDAHAIGLADFRRNFTVGTSLRWHARRQVQFARRRVLHGIDRVSPALAAHIRALRA